MKPPRTLRVLIVEPSALYRRALMKGLALRPNIEVVGGAADAFEARELIVAKEPEALLLALDLPRMNGQEFLRRLMPQWPIPTVVLTDAGGREEALAAAALKAGALDQVRRVPVDTAAFSTLLLELVPKLRIAAATDVTHWKLTRPVDPNATDAEAAGRVICIGASTGGTEAILEVVSRFPADTPGVVMVQHMPVEFTGVFAQRLNRECAMTAKEAAHGDLVIPGRILLAPGDIHMTLRPNGGGFQVALAQGAKVCGHRPSVEVLFQSAARCAGSRAVAVMLTGMGDDGASGMAAMRQAGARTVAQDEATSVVFGMPRMAIERGGVELVRPLTHIAPTVLDLVETLPTAARSRQAVA